VGTVDPPLRIAQLAPPFLPVPPPKYGGTELVVSLLTEELVRRGHEVTLFASGDSHTSARLAAAVETAVWLRHDMDPAPYVARSVDACFQRAAEFDVIHNHLGFAAYPAARLAAPEKTLSTVHGRVDAPDQAEGHRYFQSMPLVAISNAQRALLPDTNWLGTVHHGLDVTRFPFQERGDSYVAFVGRISPEKGLDTAISAARQAGVPIKVAARQPVEQVTNLDVRRDWQYYRERIEPLLGLPGVEYVGELDSAAKCQLLAHASALLFPVRWAEPFGLVMIEALACGTPVIATRWGSVPEVIEDGVTGFVVEGEDELVPALGRLSELDRRRCRAEAERRFSAAAMVDRYETLYRKLLAGRQ
jgi:glycosyltransferase involved in cell wall biosynthesis